MNGLKDHCHCEHARETHHEGKFCCLASRCDCERYQLYSDPYVEDPTPTQRIPAARPAYDPFDPFAASPDDLDTWPMFPAAPKAWP